MGKRKVFVKMTKKHFGMLALTALIMTGSGMAGDIVVSPSNTTYYVDAGSQGDDTNPGTLPRPFKTIQHGVKNLGAGDTLYIRAGTYHEEVVLNSLAGDANHPITIKNYQDEEVTLDGTVPVVGTWTKHSGNIYKTVVPQDVWQLYVDGKMMTPARFPNALAYSDLMWDRYAVRREKKADGDGSSNGHVIDNPTAGAVDSLAGAGVSFDGCVALLNFGGNNTEVRVVSNHVAGSDNFDYSPAVEHYRETPYYFFEGGVGNAELAMLDRTEEWAYDESTKTLYLWADDGQNPNGRKVHGKTQTYAITGDAATRHIVIDGLNFFATAFSFASSDNITIQNCDFNHYAASKRALGDTGKSLTARFEGTDSDDCQDVTIYNCEFRYADAVGLEGENVENMLVENNLFNQIGYACAEASSSVKFGHTKDLVYRRNTVDVSGFSMAFAANIRGQGGTPRPIVFEYNYHTACGLQAHDASSVYMAGPNIAESVSRYNWLIGNGGRDFRWDGANKGKVSSRDGNLYRNVAMSTRPKIGKIGSGAYRLKGGYHEIYNNIGVNDWAGMNVTHKKGGNPGTVTRNNAADILTDDPLPGTGSNNFVGQNSPKTLKDLLRDPDNWDFRPRADAVELIDQGIAVTCTVNGVAVDVTAGFNGPAPDIGAYEFGDRVYWIAGRQLEKASTPIPPDGAVNVRKDADLMFLEGLKTDRHNIMFTNKAKNHKGQQELTETNIYTPGQLRSGQSYYWRVDAVTEDGSVVEGDLWSFTVEK